ncbi:hypothetical protein [Mesoterricola silvestris]|uniref:Uncharacterized protein n=1 Tax=Mesoterricola silvestris TaxID=2927979 RepID=A0AA48HAR5_9BACT|nr:hypothetical protein [Mesoterricola silvestris]BDU74868.1 hypothetical protein METEAL_40420 [Mesoterricola silvestris]
MVSFLKSAMVGCILVPTPAPASPTDEQVRQQCLEARAALDAWKAHPAPRGKVMLVLGARTQEAGRFRDPSLEAAVAPLWVFASLDAHAPSPEPHVQLDFNRAMHLHHLAAAFAGQIDGILFDHSVVKFTEWTGIHYQMLKRLLAPRGTLFLPIESWGGLSFGVNPGHLHDPLDQDRPTGDRDFDARRFGRILHLAMIRSERIRSVAGHPLTWLPGMLQVPMNWLSLPPELRAGALAFWKDTYLVPELRKNLGNRTGFRTIARVRFTPAFLKAHPSCAGGVEYLACKP